MTTATVMSSMVKTKLSVVVDDDDGDGDDVTREEVTDDDGNVRRLSRRESKATVAETALKSHCRQGGRR